MTSLAAGMEDSDYSDSEYEIFHDPSPRAKKDAKNYRNDVSNSSDGKHELHETCGPRSRGSYVKKGRMPEQRKVLIHGQILDDLRFVIQQGTLEDIEAIVKKGIYVDTILKDGWTGLMYACSSGNHKVVKYFLENDADPNYHKDMFTPLMAVCASAKPENDLLQCCKYLLEKGAKVNVYERHLATPLMFAVREGHTKIVEVLICHGADVNKCDNRGQTALFWAAGKGHGKIIRLLIENGINPNSLDKYGQTAAELAMHEGHNEVIYLFQQESRLFDIPADKEPPAINSPTQAEEQLLKINSSRFSRLQQQRRPMATHNELEIFLNGLGLGDILPIVLEHKLTLHDILIMNDEELEKIGIIQVGARNMILQASKSVHKKEWSTSSLPNLKEKQYICCPDAVALVANISKHLSYITTTVTYLRKQIQCQPRILELDKDINNVINLVEELQDSLLKTNNLKDELRFSIVHLEKVQNHVNFKPADVIEEYVAESENYSRKKKIAFFFAVVSITVGGILWKRSNISTQLTSKILQKMFFQQFTIMMPITK